MNININLAGPVYATRPQSYNNYARVRRADVEEGRRVAHLQQALADAAEAVDHAGETREAAKRDQALAAALAALAHTLWRQRKTPGARQI